MKLNVKAFALTCGIVWGLSLFLLTWWIIMFEGVTGRAHAHRAVVSWLPHKPHGKYCRIGLGVC